MSENLDLNLISSPSSLPPHPQHQYRDIWIPALDSNHHKKSGYYVKLVSFWAFFDHLQIWGWNLVVWYDLEVKGNRAVLLNLSSLDSININLYPIHVWDMIYNMYGIYMQV